MIERLCRAALRLYPAAFRRRFGRDWLEVAAWRMRGKAGVGAFFRWVVRDGLAALPGAWHDALRRSQGRRSESDGSPSARPPAHPQGGQHAKLQRLSRPVAGDDAIAALRILRRSPGFALATIATLGVGLAAAVGIFAVVHAVLLRPLPYPEADRLAMVWNDFTASGLSRLPLSPAQILALREQQDLFAEVGGVWATGATLSDRDEPLRVSMGLVTDNFLRVLGVEPARGRDFRPGDNAAGTGPVLILSDELWRSAFGADPNLVGSAVGVDGEDTPVVGVLPPGFRLTLPIDSSVPDRFDLYLSYPAPLPTVRPGQFFFRVVGRLHEGASLDQVAARMDAVNATVAERHGDLMPPGVVMTAAGLHDDAVRTVRPVLAALLGAVALLLVLGCANAAGLLSTRSSRRRAELAMRRCLGAGAWRIVRHQLIEGVLLAGLAGAAGTLVGYVAVSRLWPLRPAALSRFPEVPFDGPVFLFAALAALAAGVVFTLIGASRLPAPDALMHAPGAMGSVGPGRFKRHFVPAFEVAVTVVLLFAAGLLARSVIELQRVDLGFDAADQLTFRVALSTQRFPEAAERTRLAHLIEEEIGTLAGVTAVGGASHLPFDDVPNWSSPAAPEGTPDDELEGHYVDHRSVTPGYLAALGARLLDGRLFELEDSRRDNGVVVVDRALAERHWPDQPAVGRTMIVTQYRDGDFVPVPATVIGVVETMRRRDVSAPGDGVVFVPFAQSARWQLSVVVRAVELDGLPARIRERVAGLGAGLAASDFSPLRGWVDEATATLRLAAILGQIFAWAAVILAFAGLYAVLALAVAQRRAEIGLRMALGARRAAVFRAVLIEGLLVAVAGAAAGIPVALATSGYLEGLLVVGGRDPATAVIVVAAIVLIATAATVIPAWTAAGADPARSLRG